MKQNKLAIFLTFIIFNFAVASPAVDQAMEQAKLLRGQEDVAILEEAVSQIFDYGEQERLENAIEQLLKKELALENFSLINSKETDFFGKSKDEVFFVRDLQTGALQYVVKAFQNPETFSGRLLPELSAMALLQELPQETFKPVIPLAVGQSRWNSINYGLLVQSVAPGVRIDQYVLDHDLKEAIHMFRIIGKNFAALHAGDPSLVATLSEEVQGKLRKHYEALLNPEILPLVEDKLDFSKLKKEVERVLEEVASLSFVRSYQHESAHVRNIFFDEETDQVTFIDVAKMHPSIDSEGNPLLDPVCDLVRLQESLNHQMVGILTQDEMDQLILALYDGYREAGGILDERLKHFYTLSSKLSRIKSNAKYEQREDPADKEKRRLTFESSLSYVQQLLERI